MRSKLLVVRVGGCRGLSRLRQKVRAAPVATRVREQGQHLLGQLRATALDLGRSDVSHSEKKKRRKKATETDLLKERNCVVTSAVEPHQSQQLKRL